MKSPLILFLFPLFLIGVFGEPVSVLEGDSVTLHTDTQIHEDEEIEWKFGQVSIASISKGTSKIVVYVKTDGPFKDRLQLDNQTGDLKIMNLRTTDSGPYTLEISRSEGRIAKTFNLMSTDKLKSVSVLVGDSVTLNTDLTKTQRCDGIRWRFEHQNSLIAEINRAAGVSSTSDGADGRFRDRLKLDHQTGSLTIQNIGTKHTGLYEVDISIIISSSSSSRYTIHTSFSVTVSDELKSVLVTKGGSVTLPTGVTELQRDDFIQWMFGDTKIAEFNKLADNITVYDDGPDGRFRDRLKLDHQTGSLTITDITTEHDGHYDLQISSSRRTIHRRFTVTVRGEIKPELSVLKGDSVSLNSDLTKMMDDDLILWRFGDKNTLIAEINKRVDRFTVHDDVLDGRFRDRLKLDHQTGSLSITNIKTEHDGVYKLQISSGRRTIHGRFTVTVIGSGLSSGAVARIVVVLVLVVVFAAAALIYQRREISKLKEEIQRNISVPVGRSVTLSAGYEIERDDDVLWKYEDEKTPIARMNRGQNISKTSNGGRFGDRLELDQTGSLTITNTTNTDSGVYKLEIKRGNKLISLKPFKVTVCDKMERVKVKESITLKPDVDELKTGDEIEWRFKDSLIAQTKLGTEKRPTYHNEEIFENSLKLDHQTGSLTITGVRSKYSGLYEQKIIRSGVTSFKRYILTVFGATETPEDTALDENNRLLLKDVAISSRIRDP